MVGDWKNVSLAEIYEFSSGLSKPRSEFGTGFPFLSFKDVFYKSAVPAELSELVKSTEQDRKRCSVRRGDVFLTRTSETLNELGMSSVALVDIPDATFNGFTKRLRPKQENIVVPEFARYFFRSGKFRTSINSLASMSTRASLNNEMLERLTISFPSIEEQREIGNILGALDDKIELNRRMNQTLEAMARALFKSRFVDFDGVSPEDMQESELGLIPKGWRVSTVGEEVAVFGGSTPSTKETEYWDSGLYHWVTPKDLSSLTFPVLLDTERKITELGLAKITSGLLPVGTLLLSSRAPIGYLAITEVATAINQGFIAMKCDKLLSNVFMLNWCREKMQTIIGNANGSTFLEISKSNFRPIPIVVPPAENLRLFDEKAKLLHQRLVENERQSQTLIQIRDALLPKLISGELRVKDIGRIAETV